MPLCVAAVSVVNCTLSLFSLTVVLCFFSGL